MGSNGFSSERKQKRVDLLKQLLDTNISTQGSSNPLEALLSGLDLGSLEGLMQKNKKSHHDDWDSKKKRHHDDCSDHDGDHKKKRHHDDWDHKKKHDHDDCGCDKKKHDHDDCGCKKKKHDHDDCGCKKKKRCKCCPDVTQEFRDAINEICRLLNAGITPANLAALKVALGVLEDLLLENEDCIDEEIAEDLLELINIIQAAATVADIPPGTLDELGRQLNKLRRCLGLRVRVCRPGGGGGQFECNCNPGTTIQILRDIVAILDAIDTGGDVAGTLAALQTRLGNPPASGCVNSVLAGLIINFPTPIDTDALVNLLIDLALCVALGIRIPPGQTVAQIRAIIENFLGVTPTPPTTPLTTVRQQLLDLVADQVAITTPTGVYVGTLVTVQFDYIAVVNSVGTYLIPIDEITAFTTE
ncbi:hypothetical protein [Priestia megaterium]|uniref:hypothetical protein n=1 Tax=Priestia megaterium TaxID=1404 RepID=UPI003879539B